MKQEKIYDALNYIDETMIEEVDELRIAKPEIAQKKGLYRKKVGSKTGRMSKLAKHWYKFVAVAAVLCVFVAVLGKRPVTAEAVDLMEGIQPQQIEALADLSTNNSEVTDFGIRLFQATMKEGENTLLSPLSVISALAMTANGAEGETLAQMEEVLGLSTKELNTYMYTYMSQLPESENYQLKLANSIWFTDAETFQVEKDFLQTNANYYGADIYKRKFDGRAADEINLWISQKTEEMIPEILDKIPQDAVMYLVNALAFEAEWERTYEGGQIRKRIFTSEDGTERSVELMCEEKHMPYLEDELATGFLKYYKDGKYAFVALLPKEGVCVSEYVASLSGEGVQSMLKNAAVEKVYTAIPKFEAEYNVELSQVLAGMGMVSAFDVYKADFTGLGQDAREGWNIYISRVLHKTYIQVGEQGTKAGAATVVEAPAGGTGSGPVEEPKRVVLNRPFVYMLVDTENNLPFFIGTLMDVE